MTISKEYQLYHMSFSYIILATFVIRFIAFLILILSAYTQGNTWVEIIHNGGVKQFIILLVQHKQHGTRWLIDGTIALCRNFNNYHLIKRDLEYSNMYLLGCYLVVQK